MHIPNASLARWFTPVLLGLMALAFAGCQSNKAASDAAKSTPASTTAAAASAKPAEPPKPKVVLPTIRINAGSAVAFTDNSGNVWLADQGFVGGDVIERPDLAIGNAKDPTIYRTERYSMESFSHPLPNGKYAVKLHFAETFEGITDKGERVFHLNVEGQEYIKFTHNIENPEINGIEIIPEL